MLEDTGERYIPAPEDAHYEHPHRYLLARSFASGRRVADLASGEGYGSSWLADVAADVIGLDVADEAVRHAAARYRDGRANLRFARAALEKLPLADRSVDLVTCFEAIEHVRVPATVTAEIARILAPGGVAIISTPNKRLHTDELGIRNPFHLAEMYLAEFEALLRGSFDTVVLLGQRTIGGSWAWPLERQDKELSEFLVAPELGRLPDTAGSLEPMYVLAYCANGRPDLQSELATTSLFLDRELSLLGYYDRAARGVEDLKIMSQELREAVSRADHRASQAESELDAVRNSKVMRYTSGLRQTYGRARGLLRRGSA
jgi:SAM-dependent methyltransferase